MKDPIVEKLVSEFYLNVEQLNKTWAKLVKKNIFISTEVSGDYQMGSPKELIISRLEETVDYRNNRKTKND